MSLTSMSQTLARRARSGQLDVVVVGGGVVGAAMALALLRDGRRVALIESREPAAWQSDSPDLRVYAIAPDSLALLDDLDVGPALRAARVQPYRRMRVWDAAGDGELCFDADSVGRTSLGAIVEHSLLVDRLWQALRQQPGFIAHLPATVVEREQNDAGIELRLDDGSRVRAALAVAADGADSVLRGLASIDFDRHDYGQRGIVAFVESEQPHEATAWQRFLPGGPLAVLPFVDWTATHQGDPDGKVSPLARHGRCSSIVWTVADGEAARLLALTDEEFAVELTRAFDARLGAMRLMSPRAAFPLRRQLAKSYVSGRIVLAGDAAHAVHPLAGQGVNLGLRDVSGLRRILSGVETDALANPRLLTRYARERRSDNAVAAWSFDGINRLFSNDALLPTLLRGPALGMVNRFEPLRQLFASRALGG